MVIKTSRSTSFMDSHSYQGRPREEPLRVTVHYRNLSGTCGNSCDARDGGFLSSTASVGRWGSVSSNHDRQAGSLSSEGVVVRPSGVRRVRFDLPASSSDGSDTGGGGGVGGALGSALGAAAPSTATARALGRHQSPSMRQPGQQPLRSPWSSSSTRTGTHSTLAQQGAVLAAARDADHHALIEILRRNPPPSTLNYRDAQGRTAASHLAGGSGSSGGSSAGLLELLLQCSGVDVNQADSEGNTPLHLAAQAGQLEAVNALLRRQDVQVDARNAQGFTPLMKAALQGRTKCARALLLAGASPTLRDSGRGLRAEQWARFCGRHVCAELIERLARQRLLDRTTAYGRWGSEPELQAALGRVQHAQAVAQQAQSRSIRSRVRRAFRAGPSGTSSSSSAVAPAGGDVFAPSHAPAFSLVTQLTGAGLCASTPALPVPAMPPVVKSLLRPLSVPRLQVTLARSS